MTKNEVRDCLREFATMGCFQPTKHCRKRMLKRQVTTDDVLYVLMWGNVTKVKYNEDKKNYECKVEGADIDGDPLVFVAAIYKDCHTVRCITVY